jgi:hypothetical protein
MLGVAVGLHLRSKWWPGCTLLVGACCHVVHFVVLLVSVTIAWLIMCRDLANLRPT